MTIVTAIAIIVAATIGLIVGVNLGYATALITIRQSGYVVQRVPGEGKARYRIGVRSDAAPVVPAVEWIAPAVTVDGPMAAAVAGRLGHKPRGSGR